jgi:hypothetical protein
MKSIVATLTATTLLATTAVSAFAPRQSTRSEIARPATAELEGLVGVDLESGKKIVSTPK